MTHIPVMELPSVPQSHAPHPSSSHIGSTTPNPGVHVPQQHGNASPEMQWTHPPVQLHFESQTLHIEHEPGSIYLTQHQVPGNPTGHECYQSRPRSHQSDPCLQGSLKSQSYSEVNKHCHFFGRDPSYDVYLPYRYPNLLEQTEVGHCQSFAHQQNEWNREYQLFAQQHKCKESPTQEQAAPQEPSGHQDCTDLNRAPQEVATCNQQECGLSQRTLGRLDQSHASGVAQPQQYGTQLGPEQCKEAPLVHSGRTSQDRPRSPPFSLAYNYPPPQSVPTECAPTLAFGTLQIKLDSNGIARYTILDHTGTAIPTIIDKDGTHLTLVNHRGNYMPTFITPNEDGYPIRITYDEHGNTLTPDDHGNLVPFDHLFSQQRLSEVCEEALNTGSESRSAVSIGDVEPHHWGDETGCRLDTYGHATDDRTNAFHPMFESVDNLNTHTLPPRTPCGPRSRLALSPAVCAASLTVSHCQPPVAGGLTARLDRPPPSIPRSFVAPQGHQLGSVAFTPEGKVKLPPKRSPLACFFCRDRKIACGSPLPGSRDKRCNQCARRNVCCMYPAESRRGVRKSFQKLTDPRHPAMHTSPRGGINKSHIAAKDPRRSERNHMTGDY